MSDPDEQRGLYQKYDVRRINGTDPLSKHVDCEYFVLDLNHDPYAAFALRAYADACAERYPQLAADLRVKMLEVFERHAPQT